MAAKNKEHGRIITETKRLIIREMVQSDFDALCKILCDEEVMRAAYEKAFSVEEAQAWMNRQFKRYAECGFGLWAVVLKETNEMIGQCGLTMQGWREKELLEIGYLFQKAYWHNGYATEAAIACKEYAFSVLNANSVYSIIRNTHTASQNVASRNGMKMIDQFTKNFIKPLVAFLLERGSFSSGSTAMTAGCLAFYALGVPFYALREIGIRALSAHMEQKRILKNTVISVVCNIALDLALIRPLGYVGLALATSLAGLIAALLMFSDLRKLNMRILERQQIPEFLKISAAAAISLVLCWCAYSALLGPLGGSPALVIAGLLAIAAYVLLSVWLRIEIFVWLYDRLPTRLQIFPPLNRRQN